MECHKTLMIILMILYMCVTYVDKIGHGLLSLNIGR